MVIGFHHGALCDSYEEQANAQGFTFGVVAEWVEKILLKKIKLLIQ